MSAPEGQSWVLAGLTGLLDDFLGARRRAAFQAEGAAEGSGATVGAAGAGGESQTANGGDVAGEEGVAGAMSDGEVEAWAVSAGRWCRMLRVAARSASDVAPVAQVRLLPSRAFSVSSFWLVRGTHCSRHHVHRGKQRHSPMQLLHLPGPGFLSFIIEGFKFGFTLGVLSLLFAHRPWREACGHTGISETKVALKRLLGSGWGSSCEAWLRSFPHTQPRHSRGARRQILEGTRGVRQGLPGLSREACASRT